MNLALAQAKEALACDEVPIGCVIVRDGQVVATGRNATNATHNATRHAEMVTIDQMLAEASGNLAAARFSECELYVTCEPCIMCAGALCLLRFGPVHYGCVNTRFGGCGSVLDVHQRGCGACGLAPGELAHSHKGLSVTGGLMEAEAIDLLRKFYMTGNPKAPRPHRPLAGTSPA
ncbi:hypothetical protein WJX73_007048 [Symbiochloris irregularis]|uniref:CMP/dCMP-type deaminase domain-containing protein n=1 Tax=Symbiochloris irregularis TaxID=706552 RepID=A0AAW1NQ53_9CHLO